MLSPGARLGPYEITASLGRGGMGEVYQAHDTRLDRTVAIKIMAGGLASRDDAGSLEQEARAVAALNHPHICALHDVGRDRDTSFLVMEYVHGETLAARLTRGAIATREMIRIAIQIAEALDHAHRHGVVHRDLKPANVMLTSAGVKVLDFGLATLRAAAPLAIPVEGTPTVRHPLASERALLGTIHYMAPERLEGRDADAASDLFALGAVMYEMATGQRPFDSASPAGVIAAILHTDPPPPSTIQPDLPPALDWIIEKALAKKPEARWRAAGDVVEVLRWIARPSTPLGAGPSTPLRAGSPADTQAVDGRALSGVAGLRGRLLPIAIAAALIVIAVVFLAFARGLRTVTPEAQALTFSILPPPGGGFTPTPSSVPTPQFALSPDGRRLVYVAAMANEAPQLWIRPLDSLDAQPVPGTHGAEYPFWSPDSESLGFFANASLKRVDLAGGPPRMLAVAPHGRGGAWSRSGLILFAPNTQSPLYRVPAAGGDATPLTHVDAAHHESSHRWPQFLADDRHFVYFVQTTSPESHIIYLGDLDGSAPRMLVASPLSAAYVPPDHLLFVVDNALMAARFGERGARILGEPMPIVSPVAGSSNFYAAFSASQTGLLAYASSAASAELVWFDRGGRRTGSLGPPAEYVDFRLSPDDRQLALAEVDPQSHRPDIRVLDLVRGTKLRLTLDAVTDASPVWSPDGRQIVFRSNPDGPHNLYQIGADGAAGSKPLLETQNAKYPTDWSRDGRKIVYHTYVRETGSDIWLVAPDGSRATPLVQTPFDEVQGQISPDERWLAYTSLETDRPEVYIRSLSNAGTRWQVSAGGGTDPRWRGDTRELFYASADSWLMSVSFVGARPGTQQRLFPIHMPTPVDPYLSNYNVTSDGQRFLLKVPAHDVTSTPIHVLSNWLHAKRGS
jgi:serine/threonine protein kinase